jgi:hypothetical protein
MDGEGLRVKGLGDPGQEVLVFMGPQGLRLLNRLVDQVDTCLAVGQYVDRKLVVVCLRGI